MGEKSRLFRQFYHLTHLIQDGFVAFALMGAQAMAAILDAIVQILEIAAAAVPQAVQGAIAEQAAEFLRVCPFMAREILALLILKKIVVCHRDAS